MPPTKTLWPCTEHRPSGAQRPVVRRYFQYQRNVTHQRTLGRFFSGNNKSLFPPGKACREQAIIPRPKHANSQRSRSCGLPTTSTGLARPRPRPSTARWSPLKQSANGLDKLVWVLRLRRGVHSSKVGRPDSCGVDKILVRAGRETHLHRGGRPIHGSVVQDREVARELSGPVLLPRLSLHAEQHAEDPSLSPLGCAAHSPQDGH